MSGRESSHSGEVARKRVDMLEQDPELGEELTGERLQGAFAQAQAQTIALSTGPWPQREWPSDVRAGAGLLVLDGLLLRRVGLEGRYGAELLARGDLLRPWEHEDALATVPSERGWQVLRRTWLAQLDVEFVRRTAAYPEIHTQLIARALRRSRHLAVNMAIVHQPRVQTRVHMLLWHLADRWGIVRPDGVLMPERLTHAILGELVAARRPTVSAALGALSREGQVVRNGRGWLLRGSPPGELQDLATHGRDAHER